VLKLHWALAALGWVNSEMQFSNLLCMYLDAAHAHCTLITGRDQTIVTAYNIPPYPTLSLKKKDRPWKS
jgi:hypothetical protein